MGRHERLADGSVESVYYTPWASILLPWLWLAAIAVFSIGPAVRDRRRDVLVAVTLAT